MRRCSRFLILARRAIAAISPAIPERELKAAKIKKVRDPLGATHYFLQPPAKIDESMRHSFRFLIVFAILTIVTIHRCVASDIPFNLEENIILVKGNVNGRGPYTFIVDTGATETVITPSTAERIGIPSMPWGSDQRVGTVESISLGEAMAKNLRVYIFDPPQALTLRLDSGIDYQGILGFNFLSQFLISIDYQAKKISLDSAPLISQAETVGRDTFQLPFELKDHHIHIQGRINDKGPIDFLVDTGAAQSVLIPKIARQLGITGKPLKHPENSSWAEHATIGLGHDLKAEDVPVLIFIPTTAAMYGISYDGILGYDFLSKFKVSIDYKNKVLIFSPSNITRSNQELDPEVDLSH